MLVRIISSSSTSTMEGLRFSPTLLHSFFPGLQRNPHVEGGPVSPRALEADGAAVVFRHNPLHHQQAKARASAYRLGCKSPLQHFRLILFANSVSRVGNPDMHGVAFEPRAGGNLAASLNR